GGDKVLGRPLCGRSVSDIVKLSVVKARGQRPRKCEVSGHSLRVGAAQDLLIRGHDISAIMRAGGWDSVRVVSNYLRLAEHNIWE
ncbi:tyrosine-type recombinase/integrase, partial [Paracoccaceae bacterium]|nr:tyrosine-type recombinase/integrase [Paracoccaceae bacterium]